MSNFTIKYAKQITRQMIFSGLVISLKGMCLVENNLIVLNMRKAITIFVPLCFIAVWMIEVYWLCEAINGNYIHGYHFLLMSILSLFVANLIK
jgi:hypothetical protein